MEPSSFRPIRANPLLSTFKSQFILSLIIIIVLFVFLIALLVVSFMLFQSNEGRFVHFFVNELPLVTILILNSFTTMLNFRQWRYWKRIEQRRIATVRGDQSLLAAEQPAANAVTLLRPFTLTLRYSMGSLLRLAGMLWIFLVVYVGLLGWIMNSAWSGDLIPMSEPLIIGVIVAVAGALLVLPVFLLRGRSHTVEVAEQGISMDVGGTLSFVRWEEARLFAVYRSFGARSDQSSLTYELSSMTDIVRWTECVWHPAIARFQMTPTIPLAQYQQQVQALNALVAARTGLPLFDLRKESTLDKVSLKALNP